MSGQCYVRIPVRSNAILNNKKHLKHCFIWSILVFLHAFENDNPNRVSNFGHNFNELIIEGFDFTNGFKCSEAHKFEKPNSLSVNMFQLNFYQDGNNRKHNLYPIEISINESDIVVELLINEIIMPSLKNYMNFWEIITKFLYVDDV